MRKLKTFLNLKKKYGQAFICSTCGIVYGSEGFPIDEEEMGNNYSYVILGGKTRKYTICACGNYILLGGV